ncbi:MAG: hypothetical protein NWE76_09305 [Candidatus Bathyarchaeota archaeon]|nr:hypothetical protein [Candidatus Bathyarchaeota archaeon]
MQRTQPPIMNFPHPPISSLRSLSFNIEELDRLFGELRRGQLVFFHGSRMSHVLSELLCVRNLLPHIDGGLDSSVVFIDGGNIFDPYLISENARLFSLDPEETLRNIWVSRAFTSHQLTALITEKLPEILDREDSKLVIVSDIAALYCDSDIGTLEAKTTFNHITLFLWNLARENNLLLVTTSLSSRGERKRRLEQYIHGRADIAARVEAGNPHVKVTLEKHPSKPEAATSLFMGEPIAQYRLEDFMEV